LKKGDRIAMIAYNCLEWMEFYGACAKGGFVAVPIMFRLTPQEYPTSSNDSEAKAFIVEKPFVETVNEAKGRMPTVADDRTSTSARATRRMATSTLEDLFAVRLHRRAEPPR
jgi:fatty-acyl-CoA synthase